MRRTGVTSPNISNNIIIFFLIFQSDVFELNILSLRHKNGFSVQNLVLVNKQCFLKRHKIVVIIQNISILTYLRKALRPVEKIGKCKEGVELLEAFPGVY